MILIPELNNGQLIKIIRDQYLVDAKDYNKIMGIPFTKSEVIDEVKKTALIVHLTVHLIPGSTTVL